MILMNDFLNDILFEIIFLILFFSMGSIYSMIKFLGAAMIEKNTLFSSLPITLFLSTFINHTIN